MFSILESSKIWYGTTPNSSLGRVILVFKSPELKFPVGSVKSMILFNPILSGSFSDRYSIYFPFSCSTLTKVTSPPKLSLVNVNGCCEKLEIWKTIAMTKIKAAFFIRLRFKFKINYYLNYLVIVWFNDSQ